MPHLRLDGLSKRYGSAVAADSVTLSVERGESVALLGPSGCGKTTTLRMVSGLISPDAGTIAIDAVDVTRLAVHKRNIGYVFQSYALFPHMSVADNVGFGLRERRVPRAEIATRVREALEMVRLSGLDSRRPRELSGGQQQRVALARALVIRPSVLLLDESLSNLDAKLRDAMRHEIRDIQRSLGITTLLVTHDQVEALTMCDRIAVMNAGRVVQIGTPNDIYERPATRFVAEFVGRSNVLPVERDPAGRPHVLGSRLPIDCPPGAIDAFVRPQRCRIAAVGEPHDGGVARVEGRVARSIFVGDQIEVIVHAGGGQIIVQLPSGQPLPPEGSDVAVVWPARETLLFPRDGA